jgi:hypothetical protein
MNGHGCLDPNYLSSTWPPGSESNSTVQPVCIAGSQREKETFRVDKLQLSSRPVKRKKETPNEPQFKRINRSQEISEQSSTDSHKSQKIMLCKNQGMPI